MRLVAAAVAEGTPHATFREFLAAHPELADKAHLFRFYSAVALSAPGARDGWVEPDLAPLPGCAAPDGAAANPTAARRSSRLRTAFLLGAITDALAVFPLLVPSLAALLWGFDDRTGPYRFATGYAASLMLAWTGLLLWARRRPLERAFVAPLTVIVIYGLVATEVASVLAGDLAVWRMAPTWIIQLVLLAFFATAYHDPAWLRRAGRRASRPRVA